MVIVVVLLLSIKANQDYVQSLKQRENEKQSKLAALETRNKELTAKLKTRSGFNTDVSAEGNSPEFDELNEKYQNLQEKYQKVYEELELQQKETQEARLAAEKAAAAIPAEKPDPSAEEKSLREQVERLEHSCGKLRLDKKQLQESLTKAEKRCEELEYGLNRSGEIRASETEENEELRSELESLEGDLAIIRSLRNSDCVQGANRQGLYSFIEKVLGDDKDGRYLVEYLRCNMRVADMPLLKVTTVQAIRRRVTHGFEKLSARLDEIYAVEGWEAVPSLQKICGRIGEIAPPAPRRTGPNPKPSLQNQVKSALEALDRLQEILRVPQPE